MKTKLTLFVAVVALFFHHSLIGGDLKKGLVAHYPLKGNTKDVSGNTNHLWISGNVGFAEDEEMGLCVSFSGKKEALYGNVSHLLKGKSPFTINFWAKPKVKVGGFGTYYLGGPYGKGGQSTFVALNKKNARLDVGNAWRDFKFEQLDSKWQMLSITWDGEGHFVKRTTASKKEEIIKVVGLPASDLDFSDSSMAVAAEIFKAPFDGFCIGLSGASGEAIPMRGEMCNFRIYNRALSAEEVKALYELEKPKNK